MCSFKTHIHTKKYSRDLMFHIGKKKHPLSNAIWWVIMKPRRLTKTHVFNISPKSRLCKPRKIRSDGSGWSGVIKSGRLESPLRRQKKHQIKSCLLAFKPQTPLETNIAAENRPFHNHHFSVAMLVSGRASVPTIVLMEEILRPPVEGKVVYPMIYKVSYIPGGWEWDFSTINSTKLFFAKGDRLWSGWDVVLTYPRVSGMNSLPACAWKPGITKFQHQFANGGNFKQRNIKQNDPSRRSSTNQLT